MHTWTDSIGATHQLPKIDWQIHCRLKQWEVCDLVSIVNDPDAWESLFSQLAGDGDFIVNLAYVLEHDSVGTDDQQMEFGRLLVGENGCGSLLECSEALRQAVVDFFPEEHRDAIHQLHALTVTQKAVETIQKLCPDSDSVASDSATETNGSSQCSASSDTTEPI